MATLHDLLNKGYFPKELPPPFTTYAFAQKMVGPNVSLQNNVISGGRSDSSLCVHNLVRTGGLRRNLGIPNPKQYYKLAKHVIKHWNDLKTKAHQSPFSLTKPVDDGNNRAISPENDFSHRTLIRARLRSTSRYVLKADISRFFPSIYTHAIPWAIMGKTAAKLAFANGSLNGTWQDETDKLSRYLNSKQTVGIPIGPDTSLLLAEVILSAIDVKIARKYKKLRGIRYVDDYEFVFATRSEAEDVLSFLQQELNKYELALNPHKTEIVELPDQFDPPWISKVRVFVFHNTSASRQKNDLTAYFDMVYDFFKRFPGEGILKYAIARLQSVDIHRENWSLFESILIHCVIVEPACIPQVCDQLTHYRVKRFPVDKSRWSDCLNRIVFERIPLGQSSEAAWAMWLMKLLNIKLLVKSAKVIGECEDSVAGLMAHGLATSGLANSEKLKGLNRFGPATELYKNQWLLCYQGNFCGFLGVDSGPTNLRNDPFFYYLASKDVSFFDIDVSPPAPTRLPIPLPYTDPHTAGGY